MRMAATGLVRAVSGEPSLPLGFALPIAPEIMRGGLFTGPHAAEGSVPIGLTELAARSPDAASLVVPLWQGGTLIGILNIEGDATTIFDADDLSLAQSLADAVALALDNARLYEDINDERSRLQASIRFNRDGIVLLGMNQRILVINAPALHYVEFARRAGGVAESAHRGCHPLFAAEQSRRGQGHPQRDAAHSAG